VSTPHSSRAAATAPWTTHDAEQLYGIRGWGQGYFSIGSNGHVLAHPTRDPQRSIDLHALVASLAQRGLETPLLIRFADASAQRVRDLSEAFSSAIKEMDYTGDYRCVYPIKTNQQRHVVEEFHEAGRDYGFGLECGSKPELLAVLGTVQDNRTPIVCNGFKDRDYAEAVVLAAAIGRDIYPVIEQASELGLLLDAAETHGVALKLGARVKLASSGSGRWSESGGNRSKFGLTVVQLLRMLDALEQRGMAGQFAMLHFHIGSQINSIAHVKTAVAEAARVYCELRRLGAGLSILDIGGGLGIDYDGDQSGGDGSVNYGLQEYANDIVYHVKQLCDEAGQPHPTLFSESGRALVAYHSVLITNTLGVFKKDATLPRLSEQAMADPPDAVKTVVEAYHDITDGNALEAYHDAQSAWHDVQNLFRLGHCTLKQRAIADRCYAAVCGQMLEIATQAPLSQHDREAIERELADTVFINLSVFQSLPDHWAIGQRFPVMPIHRLDEQPTRRSTLADITCDSDGRINRFAGPPRNRETLLLHRPAPPERYLLGVFLVGAYQETLGDLHNLFGDTNAVHVRLPEPGASDPTPAIEEVIEGDTSQSVLSYVQYDPAVLRGRLDEFTRYALAHERCTAKQAQRLRELYDQMLGGRTYLT